MMRTRLRFPVKKMLRVGLLGLFVSGAAFAGTAAANHTSSDVATGTFFHNSVGWLVEQGIADGYPDGTFRTGSSISRGQMAYWLGNYNSGFQIETGSVVTGPSTGSIGALAFCNEGQRPLSGGGTTDSPDAALVSSAPGGAGNWIASWVPKDGGVFPTSGETFTAYVLCGPETVAPAG